MRVVVREGFHCSVKDNASNNCKEFAKYFTI